MGKEREIKFSFFFFFFALSQLVTNFPKVKPIHLKWTLCDKRYTFQIVQPVPNFDPIVKPGPTDYWVSCCVTKHRHSSSQLPSSDFIMRPIRGVFRCYPVCER